MLVEELKFLMERKAQGKSHPKEDTLSGGVLSAIHYLRLYTVGCSVRLYFVVITEVLWMLMLDANKRQTNLSERTKKALAERLKDVQKKAERMREEEETARKAAL